MMAYESKIFSIDPAIEKRIHPEALKVLTNWEKFELSTLQAEVTAADIDEHLEDNERAEFKRCVDRIWEGLKTCVDVGDKVPLYDVYVGDIFLKKGVISEFQRTSLLPLFSIKLLLEEACRQKLEKERREAEQAREKKRREEKQERQEAAKAEEERRKKEEEAEAQRKKKEAEQKWHEGFKVLGEDLWDAAEHYLDDRECDKFRNAVLEAIELHVKTGGKYEEWELPFDYRWYREKIKAEIAREQAKSDAHNQARSFNGSLCKAIEVLKTKLHTHKQNTDKYFLKDNQFPKQDLTPCLLPDQRKELLEEIEHMAQGELKALVPEVYLDFISWQNTYYYRIRPIADYTFEGVACLAFYFKVEAVVESQIQLIPCQRVFRGYRFNLPVINNEGYRAILQKPKFLGYLYQHFSPIELPSIPWQTIPLDLLTGLMQGEIVPQGTKVIEASEVEVIYEVDKFDDLVDVPASFQACLGEMQGFEGMVTAGVISNQTFRIIREQTTELSVTSIEDSAALEQQLGYTKEEFINKANEWGYPKQYAEILYAKASPDLPLEEALTQALQ
jgi:hypothetical protein